MQKQCIEIPQNLIKNKQFALNILENNQKMYSHIEYLKWLVQNIYQSYRKMNTGVLKITEEYDKKISKYNDCTALAIQNFIKGIDKIYANIQSQMSNNTVALNKKSKKVSKTRKDIIYQKLIKINQLFKLYYEKVQQFNKKEANYRKEAQYFKSIEEDVIKFYSTKINMYNFEKLRQKEVKLQELMQETYSMKIQLKSGLSQLRLSLKEFFQMLSNNVQDDKKLLLSVRKKLKDTKIFNETIIEQVSSEAQESNRDGKQNQNVSTSKLQIFSQFQNTWTTLKSGVNMFEDRKQIIKSMQVQGQAIDIFCDFAEQFQYEIMQIASMIDSIRDTKQFLKFDDKKVEMTEILASDMIMNIKIIKNQIADMRQIIESVKELLNKKKVICQLKKYRHGKYEKFLLESQQIIMLQKKRNDDQNLRNRYSQLKGKFMKNHIQYMKRLRQMIQELFREINEKFKVERNTNQVNKNTVFQMFKKNHYNILSSSFLTGKEQPPKFQSCNYLLQYSTHLNEQNLKKVGLGNEQKQTISQIKHFYGCCGLISSNHKQKNVYLDEFNCALKKGVLLIQGKMKIHQNYLKFISSFNTKTIFGSSNIRIPKSDIKQIEKGQYLLSIMITFVTIYGRMQFTSFINDPYDKLEQVYSSSAQKNMLDSGKSKSKYSNNLKNYETARGSAGQQTIHNIKSEIQQIQQKLQFEIPELLDKNIFIIQSLNTYLSEDKRQLSVSIVYHLAHQQQPNNIKCKSLCKSKNKYFFEIKLKQNYVTGNIEYTFVHETSLKDHEAKTKLQKMATNIINSKNLSSTNANSLNWNTNNNNNNQTIKSPENKQQQQTSKFKSKSKQLFNQTHNRNQNISQKMSLDSCSFIEKKQRHELQFDKDPSFVYVKDCFGINEGQTSFNYTPQLSILKKVDSDKKLIKRTLSKQISNYSRSQKQQQRSLSKKDINQFINSIDEKAIQRQLNQSQLKRVDSMGNNYSYFNNNKFSSQSKLSSPKFKTNQDISKFMNNSQSQKQKNNGINLGYIGIIIVVALLLNFIVSIKK